MQFLPHTILKQDQRGLVPNQSPKTEYKNIKHLSFFILAVMLRKIYRS